MKQIYILFILISVVFIGYSGLSVLGCAWEPHGFTCETFTPVLFWCSLFSLFLSVSLLRSSFLGNTTKSKIMTTAVVILILFPFAINIIYYSFDENQRNKYYYGFTPEACSKGKPSVPWGKWSFFGSDGCYLALNMCKDIRDDFMQEDCYFNKDSQHRNVVDKSKIPNESSCGLIRDINGQANCKIEFAAEKGDWKVCESFTTDYERTTVEMRTRCFNAVADYPANENFYMQTYGIDHQDNKNACDQFSGLKKDSCLYWVGMYSEDNEFYCNQIETSDIFKKDCMYDPNK